MNMQLWYCPKCDKETMNYRVCGKCGELAVYQNFDLVPVPHDSPLPECFINRDKPKRKKGKSQ